MFPSMSDEQLIALCQQRGLALVAPAEPPPATPSNPALSRANSAAYGLGLQLDPSTSPSLSVLSAPITQEYAQASHTTPLLNVAIPRHHPLHSSWVPTSGLNPSTPATPTPPLSSFSAHRQPQRRTEKRKYHKIQSGMEESSGAEDTHPQVSSDIHPLLAQVEKLREACTALPVPGPHFIVGSVHGGQVQDFSMHLAKRDSLIADLVNTLLNVTLELTGWTGVLEKDNILSMKYLDKGRGLIKKRKVHRTILEQSLTDAIKVLVHSMIQRTLHWKPGRTNQLPSAGATYQEKRVDGTYTPVEIRVPDWDMGPKSNENAKWMGDIKQAVKAEIGEDRGDLGHRWTDLKIQPIILEAMEHQIYTYYDTLKRQHKDQNDEERSKKRGATDLRLKRDQRVRVQRSKLTCPEVLKEVNIVVEMATQELRAPGMEIQADDLPFEALSDLESDPEGVSVAIRSKYQKTAHIDQVASVKWMSRRKIWTSEAFEELKGLFKQVANSTGKEGLVAQKRVPVALHYAGPFTNREPGLMNVQAWMVDLVIVGDDKLKGCRQSREGFVSMGGMLVRVFNQAQKFAKERKERSMDEGEGDDEAEK